MCVTLYRSMFLRLSSPTRAYGATKKLHPLQPGKNKQPEPRSLQSAWSKRRMVNGGTHLIRASLRRYLFGDLRKTKPGP